jgi:hypothetical protein
LFSYLLKNHQRQLSNARLDEKKRSRAAVTPCRYLFLSRNRPTEPLSVQFISSHNSSIVFFSFLSFTIFFVHHLSRQATVTIEAQMIVDEVEGNEEEKKKGPPTPTFFSLSLCLAGWHWLGLTLSQADCHFTMIVCFVERTFLLFLSQF